MTRRQALSVLVKPRQSRLSLNLPTPGGDKAAGSANKSSHKPEDEPSEGAEPFTSALATAETRKNARWLITTLAAAASVISGAGRGEFQMGGAGMADGGGLEDLRWVDAEPCDVPGPSRLGTCLG